VYRRPCPHNKGIRVATSSGPVERTSDTYCIWG